jgi:hypothetical protein
MEYAPIPGDTSAADFAGLQPGWEPGTLRGDDDTAAYHGRMTHEYVIALGGRIEPHGTGRDGDVSTAIAWAADRVLAVGPDDMVRAISRGDSTFLALGGCVVTALPVDPARADELVREASLEAGPDLDLGALLVDAGLVDPDAALEPGSAANLAFWAPGPGGDDPSGLPAHLVAIVRGGAFSDGDEHSGPFPAARGSTSS